MSAPNLPATAAASGIAAAVKAPDSGEWTRILRAEHRTFDFRWRELWSARDLVRVLAQRDLATTYKQTVLGPLWFVIQPLMVTVVFSYLFGRMAGFGADRIPHYLFYLGGLVPWGFFSETVNKTSTIFINNANLFSKVYFPRLAVPVSAVITNLLPLTIQLVLFLAGLGFYLAKQDPHVRPNWTILLVPLVLLQVAALGMGIGCIVSSLTRRFRDLAYGLKVGMQLWMFGSAIIFPLSRISPEQRWIFFLNPMVPPIEMFRKAFTGISYVQPWQWALSAVVSLLVLIIGVVLFNHAERTAMDTV